MGSNLQGSDAVFLLIAALAAALLGMFIPGITGLIFSEIVPSGEALLMVSSGILLIGIAVSSFLVRAAQNLLQIKITAKIEYAFQNALMNKIVNLPVHFFKPYSSGELADILQSVGRIFSYLCPVIFGGGLIGVFSAVYLFQIAVIAPMLVVPALISVLIPFAVVLFGISIGNLEERLRVQSKVNGIVFSLFSGIQKIKLGGAEKRAFAKWAKTYTEQARLLYKPLFIRKIQPVLEKTASLIGLFIIYGAAVHAQIDLPHYMSFMAAYGLTAGSMVSFSVLALFLAYGKPLLALGKPLLEASTEINNHHETRRVIKIWAGRLK
jgi:ABC-type bacteriocin/lantibiotic exporter with double-glycine peptidase domain